jgi:hypothetical protein
MVPSIQFVPTRQQQIRQKALSRKLRLAGPSSGRIAKILDARIINSGQPPTNSGPSLSQGGTACRL